MQQYFRFFILVFLLSIALGSNGVFSADIETDQCPEKLLCVVFLDVGQGDAIYIESPKGVQMLIDGGRESSVLRTLPSAMGHFDKSLDYVLLTHPDADHIGGLVGIFERYDVANIIRTQREGTSAVWDALVREMKIENAKTYIAEEGQVFDLGDAVLYILSPDENISKDNNDTSIVVRMVYGETEILLMGDASQKIEKKLISEDIVLQSDVLKVGHHGSKTSTAKEFVDVVSPTYAIISAGKDNRYGHPHDEVLETLQGVEIKNTAESGSIFLLSDGKNIWFR